MSHPRPLPHAIPWLPFHDPMLSSKAHSRHPTWPLTSSLLPDEDLLASSPRTAPSKHSSPLSSISEDDDPFSHFLSPILDEEASLTQDLDYTAGIAPFESRPASSKEAVFRARLEEKWETFVARRLLKHSNMSRPATIPPPLPEPFPQVACSPPGEDALPELVDESMDLDAPPSPDNGPSSPLGQMQWYFPSNIDDEDSMDEYDDVDLGDDGGIEEDSLDGWAMDRHQQRRQQQLSAHARSTRSTPLLRHGFRTNKQRTLSGKKHAWREPSARLWTVDEEQEEDPVADAIEAEARGSKRRKRNKSVHWNEEVQVLEYER